jgi:hypothetical protein
MKKLLTLLCFIIASTNAFAQDFTVPAIDGLKTEADYARYEKDVIACANWLENTPLNQDRDKRVSANTFMIKWISGSPSVSIALDANVVSKLADKNEQLLVLFMAGWTRYALENNYSKDNQKGYLEGLKSLINVYKKGIDIKKDKDVEKFVELHDKGELEAWIKENVKA